MSDIHEQYQNFNAQVMKDYHIKNWRFYNDKKYPVPKVDAILIAGDITNNGLVYDRVNLSDDLKVYRKEKKLKKWLLSLVAKFKCPIYFIAGNHDIGMNEWDPKLDWAAKEFGGIHNITNKVVTLPGEITCLGVSMSPCYNIPKLRDIWANMTCNQKEEEEYYQQFKDIKADLILSHCPPFGYLDECLDSDGKDCNIGSKELSKLVEIINSKLVICGHVHEGGGKTVRMGGGSKSKEWDNNNSDSLLDCSNDYNNSTKVINTATKYSFVNVSGVI